MFVFMFIFHSDHFPHSDLMSIEGKARMFMIVITREGPGSKRGFMFM